MSMSGDYYPSEPPPAAPPRDAKGAIIDALMALAAERDFADITLSEIAARADVSLADFRDAFPSKGAVLAGLNKRIDHAVLADTHQDLIGEPAKERLFDVLMRRLDAMAPYKAGLQSVFEWAQSEPLAAAALNRMAVNSMRFMLEAAGLQSEGPVGAVKLQGLVLAWTRVMRAWFDDVDPGLAGTMAALDRELSRGERFVRGAEDLDRLVQPFRSLAQSLWSRVSERRPRRGFGGLREDDTPAAMI